MCGPGALGAPRPKLEDMRGECKYPLSGRLPTVRQAKTVRHASNRSIDFHPTTAYFAHNLFRIHAPKSLIDIRPKSAYIEGAF